MLQHLISIDAEIAARAQPAQEDSIAQLLAAAARALESDITTARECVARAEALLARQVRAQGAAAQGAGLAAWQANRVVAYIDENLAQPIHADQLARVVRLSKSYFFRAFRDTFGEPPLAYVGVRRVRRAQQLLSETNESLSQVGLTCGFCDQAHFTRVFRKIVGLTPRSWRRQFAQGPGAVISSGGPRGQLVTRNQISDAAKGSGSTRIDAGTRLRGGVKAWIARR